MNLLQFETSPYLLQHARNPVDWHAWNDATLAKAQTSNKMLLISIGYSACHWCHVMERESFENDAVARLMNEHFICIKVDREERPDVDQLYMQAAHLISGRGGWPLNAMALPDGRPFYAGTYFPKANWTELLRQLAGLWENERETILNAADQIIHGIEAAGRKTIENKQASTISKSETSKINRSTTSNTDSPSKAQLTEKKTTTTSSEHQFSDKLHGKIPVQLPRQLPPLSKEEMHEIYHRYRHRIDFRLGGEKRAPKFPMPAMWEYLLHFHQLTGHEEALTALNATLINMARGGIYDHAGGGFARYSTDERWHVPHFEKMLYDNSQLVILYAHAFQQTGHTLYKDVITETIEFVERELTAPDGGFYSALDADSEGVEGQFYVWREQEIDSLLGEHAPLFKEVYTITTEGNWEHGKNILLRKNTVKLHADNHGYTHHDMEKHLRYLRNKIRLHREMRIRPGLDDKILCSWNALMVRAFFVAYKALLTTNSSEKLYTTARKQLDFLLHTFRQPDGSLKRNHKAGITSIEGLLDDYAFLIAALLEAYQTVFDEKYLEDARQLTEYCLHHFWDQNEGFFFYTHQRSTGLAVRMKEINDNVIPSSNSEMAINLYILGTLLDNTEYTEKARSMTNGMVNDIESGIYYHANWARLALLLTDEPTEVAIIGPDYLRWTREVHKIYLPQMILSAAPAESKLPLLKHKFSEGSTIAFICRNNSCGAPVMNIDLLIKELINI